jgi:LacI family transcriptional regulator
VEKEIANAHTMFNKRVDGLLVSLAYDTENIAHFDAFSRKGIPVVFFDRVIPRNDSTSVVIDNYKAAYDVTKHLIDQGCRRIMHLAGNKLRNVYADRIRGYKQALRDHNLPIDEKKLLYTSRLNEEAGTAAAEYILKMNKRPDAVFSANDTAAVYCMIKLKEAGIRIPDDIAFAGFNNDAISKIIEPNLTTVNYSGYDIGQAAVTSLISHLSGITNLRTTNMIILRADLVIRDSSLKNKSL